MNQNIILLIVSLSMITIGLGLLIYVGYVSGFIGFMGVSHWASLGILIVAGILTWMPWSGSLMKKTNSNQIKINLYHWVCLFLFLFYGGVDMFIQWLNEKIKYINKMEQKELLQQILKN